jgi:hypothetical protein
MAASAGEPEMILPDSLTTVSSARMRRTDAFYESLSARSERNWFLKTLYPMVFSGDTPRSMVKVDDVNFAKWEGKRISSIKILSLEVFGETNVSRKYKAVKLAYKAGNALHLNTRKWVLQENLLFREGDSIDPATMLRNLYYLRNLSYISEAQILVFPAMNAPDSVDVLVVIRDKFSFNVGGKISSLDKFSLRLDDHNFLGWGQQLQNVWHINPEQEGSVGWESFYSIPNIRGTFITGELSWQDLPGLTKKHASLNRPFLFPAKHGAGGLDIGESYVHPPLDTMSVDGIVLGGWYAFSSKVKHSSTNHYKYAAISLEQKWYKKRPPVGDEFGRMWHEKLLAIGSLGISKTDYRKLPHVYSFLDNERIPVGSMLEIPIGYEIGEFRNRTFIGLRGSWGNVLQNGGFLYLEGGAETFVTRSQAEQGVLYLEPLFITPLQYYGRYRTRTYCKGRIILGRERFRGETLQLSSDTFYRGNQDITGSSLLAFGVERDFIAPWDVIGFHFVIFGFVDAAMASDTPLAPKPNDFIFTEGLGIRLRNPRLVWKAIELKVAWNQSEGKFGSPGFTLSTKLPVHLLDFEGRRPKPFAFQ